MKCALVTDPRRAMCAEDAKRAKAILILGVHRMHRALSLVLVFALFVGSGKLNAEQSPPRPPVQSPVSVCPQIASCVPPWTATLVVYVVDAAGGALGQAKVSVSAPSTSRTMPISVVTDDYGVAHISIAPGQQATIAVSMAGFFTAVSGPVRPPAGAITTVTVVLELDPAAILEVLPDLSR